jgi:adenosylcobinamide-phosphate synthase
MRPRPGALLLAVGLDLVAGEPPDCWHPVRWVGRALAWADARARSRTVGEGAVSVVALAAAAAVAATAVAGVAHRLGRASVLVEALALKPAFAIRRLGTAAAAVQAALRAGDLTGARGLTGRDLVSRDTTGLDAAEVAGAAVESVAENLGDSVAAPLLAYALGGLPAAWVYRVVNTADAMWGYRNARYERFGKAAARLDDVLNLVPARVAAVSIAAGAVAAGEDVRRALRIARRDGGMTASPNAGWPMAAMAGALGVTVTKRGAYCLGGEAAPATPDAIGRSLRVFAAGTAVIVAVALVVATRRGRP